jgi:hypothetical protein
MSETFCKKNPFKRQQMMSRGSNNSQLVTEVKRPSRSKVNKKLLLAFVLLICIYFGAAIAFRAYRMNPKNKYYGFYLLSATPTVSTSEEETDRISHAMTRQPTVLERIFDPAEFIFRLIGV